MTTRRKYTPLSSPSNAGDRREGAPGIAARRGTNSAHKVKVDDSYLYYPSDKTPPASSHYRPPSFDFDMYSPPDLLATSFSSSDGSPEPNAKENRSEHRSKLLPGKGRSKSRGRERRVDTNVSKGAVILRQQLLLDQHSPPRMSSSTRGMRDPSPSPRAAVDSSTIHKPVQSNEMLLDIQDLEEQMNSIRAHLHGPDYLRESPRAAKSPSNRNKRNSDRHRSRSRLRGQHRRSKSGSSQNFDYSDLYQLPQISTADSKLDMVIQTDGPAPFDEPYAAVIDAEEESRVVPLDPPAEGQDNIESFDLGVETAKSSSSDLLNALPSPRQTHATSPSEGDPTTRRSTRFAAGVCTPKSTSISGGQIIDQNKSDLESDPGYQHALAAGTVFQTLLGEQIRFPKTWFDGERTPYLLGDDMNKKGKWSYVASVPVRSDRFLNKLIVKNRTKPGRIMLHVVVRDDLNWTPTRHIALGVYHPNARGIRETDDPVPGDESLRMVWMAVRRCTGILDEDDASFVAKETDLQRRIDTVLLQGGSFETSCRPSPLGGRHKVNNDNVRSIYGDEAPLETVFVSEKELYAILIKSADEQAMQNIKAKFSVALALLEQFVYQKRR